MSQNNYNIPNKCLRSLKCGDIIEILACKHTYYFAKKIENIIYFSVKDNIGEMCHAYYLDPMHKIIKITKRKLLAKKRKMNNVVLL